jgi:hypothetical protein
MATTSTHLDRQVCSLQLDRLSNLAVVREADRTKAAWNAGGREREAIREARAYALQIVGYVASGSMSISEAEEMAHSAAGSAHFRAAFRFAIDALLGE